MRSRTRHTAERPSVLALSTDLSTDNGIGSYVTQVLDSLGRVQPDWPCHLLTLRNGARRSPAGTFAISEARSRKAFVKRALWLSVAIRPSHILVFHISLLPLAWACALATGARLHVFVYGWDVTNNHRRIEQMLVNRVDRIHAISRWTAMAVDRFRPPFPRPKRESAITLLPPTFDEKRYFRDPAAGVEFRRRVGIPAESKVLLTVGRLDPRERQKGHDRVLAVLPALCAEVPGLTYVIAGAGDDVERLRRFASDLGVSAAVKFVGFVDDLRGCYSAADVFVMPSTQEGFGIVFLEALACGTPVVGGGIDGSASALGWGRYGYLCDPHSSESLSAALTDALASQASGDLRGQPEWIVERVRHEFGNEPFDHRLLLVLR